MAKFQLMSATGDKVLEEFEGMYLDVNGESVLVMGWDENGTLRAMNAVKDDSRLANQESRQVKTGRRGLIYLCA